jgi:hypothetical protein
MDNLARIMAILAFRAVPRSKLAVGRARRFL